MFLVYLCDPEPFQPGDPEIPHRVRLERTRPELRAQLADLAEGLAGALTELQEISRGIHPAIPTDGGLVRALKNLARRSAVPVQLAAGFTARLPAPVEVAAYYIVSEALTNTAKHALPWWTSHSMSTTVSWSFQSVTMALAGPTPAVVRDSSALPIVSKRSAGPST